MTGSALYTYILAILKRTDKTTEVYQAITDVVMDMRLRFHSEEFKTITSDLAISSIGSYSVALPSDFGHLIGDVMVRETSSDTTYPTLSKITISRYNELYPDRLNTAVGNRLYGVPKHYCIYGGDLLIGPAVDKTTYKFNFTYTTEPATSIDADTADVPFSDKYRKCLRYGVIRETYLLLENYDEASVWGQLYEDELSKVIENDYTNTRGNEPMSYNGI